MSPSNNSIENQLRSLEPAPPSLRLGAAIASNLDIPVIPQTPARLSKRVRLSLYLSWGTTAVAATIAVVLYLSRPENPGAGPALIQSAQPVEAPPRSGPLKLTPVDAREYLFDAQYEGIVFLDDGAPARRVRYQYLDTVQMQAEGESTTVAMTYPREEIRFIPINAY